MFLYIFWLVPATVFLFFFMNDRRRLINAYLFSISFGIFLLISALLLVVRTELWFNQQIGFIVFSILAILVLLSIIFSTVFLLFNGRQMMSFEGKRLANLLSLLYGIFIIGALALHFLPYFPGKDLLIYPTDFALFYSTFLYLSYVLYGTFCNYFPVRKEPDAIIVLGSGLIGDKVPPLLAQRLTKGKTIYEQFEERPKLIVSGGQGADELTSEAAAMANYLMEQGVQKDAILIENRSRTTFENLTFSKAILEEQGLGKSVLVVTNSFHALRAGVFMRRLKIPGRSVGSKTAFYYLPSAWIRETVGLVSLYWKWHATFLAFLFLPWLLSQIMRIVNYFFNH
ncbi:YdcF family protein [Streptococcus gordonii]|uniref:YdcF family protein n=1 Tax=Streptococcus gordonii TaxID=1302 RepID=UPI001EDCEB78|nr:YdcF family protein [Streptococcus gordonii]MCG4822343.1 YdcF family protein [Streptococcus gordonii]MCG4847645.1 YdcF family protein [Streptococcus gordonii]MDE8686273.1 YdcF family protein [Streptococcus gordonii]